MRHLERALHTAVAKYLDAALPAAAYWFPVPNASIRNIAQAANMKRAGELKPGVPDIFIIHSGRAIGVELKVGKAKPTTNQVTAHASITLAGGIVATVNSLDALYYFLSQIISLKARP